MTMLERIAEEALKLPPEDRAFLVDKLEKSLPHDGFATAEIAKAWASEVERRIEAYDSGQTQAIGFDEVMRQIRQRLAEHRDRKAAT